MCVLLGNWPLPWRNARNLFVELNDILHLDDSLHEVALLGKDRQPRGQYFVYAPGRNRQLEIAK